MQTNDAGLTERQQREREYYEQFSQEYFAHDDIDYDIVNGEETRPWNPYWFTYQYLLEHVPSGGRCLDFGCGAGGMSILLASQGFEMSGFDISPGNIAIATERAKEHNQTEKTEFVVSTAESLPFDDNTFDAIAGLDILHHIDIPCAMKECYRILKPGAFAIFREPVEAVGFDVVRNSALVRYFFPKTKSFERHITDDERKLNKEDNRILHDVFDRVEEFPFSVLARFHRILPGQHMRLEKLDRTIFRLIPKVSSMAGCIVYVLYKG